MNSHEVLILFIAVLLSALMAVSALYSTVQKGVNTSKTVSEQVKNTVMKDFAVIEVHPDSNETNIYVQGVSGSLDVRRSVVIVNGISYTPQIIFVYDGKNKGMLDPGDMLLLEINTQISDTDCVRIGIDGVYTTRGVC